MDEASLSVEGSSGQAGVLRPVLAPPFFYPYSSTLFSEYFLDILIEAADLIQINDTLLLIGFF